MYGAVSPEVQGLCKRAICLARVRISLGKITVVLILSHSCQNALSSQ